MPRVDIARVSHGLADGLTDSINTDILATDGARALAGAISVLHSTGALDWLDDALCADLADDPSTHASIDTWFPELGDPGGRVKEATAICGDCPVRAECLAYADRFNLTKGIFGGQTQKQREARLVAQRKAGDLAVRPSNRPRRSIRTVRAA